MKVLPAIAEGFCRWIDATAGAVVALSDYWSPHRVVRLAENEVGGFVIRSDEGSLPSDQRAHIIDGKLNALSAAAAAALSGNRIELVLHSNRFIFRPLELPDRATEFLDGIVRAQVNSLTPWNAADAVFGWSEPTQVSADRMVITIAATARALISPYMQAFANAGAHSISVFASAQQLDSNVGPIKVWDERAQAAIDIRRIRRFLIFMLAASGITAGIALAASILIGASLETQQDELSRQIAHARTAAGIARAAQSGSTTTRGRLVQRKHEAPSSVMILEYLSQLLPDHTYVTELRVEGNKLRIIGITRDAPSLVGLLEQSGRFTRASFFAPTTRIVANPGERFHIEAIIQPASSSRL